MRSSLGAWYVSPDIQSTNHINHDTATKAMAVTGRAAFTGLGTRYSDSVVSFGHKGAA